MSKPQIRLEKETLGHIRRLREMDPVIKSLSLPKLVNILIVDGVSVRATQKQEKETAAA